MSNKPTAEELKKSIDVIVDEVLAEQTSEEVQKSAPKEHNPANGGDDKIRSGSPMTEEQKAEAAKKSKEKEDKEKEDEEKKDKKEMKKSEEAPSEEVAKAAAQEEKKEAAAEVKEETLTKKMKKSLEELSEHLDSDEIELIKAWRDEQEAEKAPEKVDAQEIAKSVTQAISAQMEEIKKSLSQKDDVIKSLSEQVNKLSSQPAYDKKAIDSLEPLEKSNGGAQPDAQTLSKANVLETMFDLQKSGKGITSTHITEYEVTKNISNPNVRALVMNETLKRFSK